MRRAALLLLTVTLLAVSGPAGSHEPGTGAAGTPGDAVRRRDVTVSATPRLPVIKAAPDLLLRDTTGEPVRLADLRGQVVMLSFIYTNCTSACPLLTARMKLVQSSVASSGHRDAVRFLSVTVDPERDGAQALRDYAARFRVDPRTWRFLRDERAPLAATLAVWDEWTRRLPSGDIDHPARVYLIDRRGNVREIYGLTFFDERQARIDVMTLLKEAPP